MTTPTPDSRQTLPSLDPDRTIAALSGAADATPDQSATMPTSEDGALPEADRPTVPGYRILGVLGRGGMGVVYKAWQVGLNRPVALKMILAGAHAAPSDLVRFLAEAEAVASLQHTNIVQIYQIGRQGDLPFFSLEYINGGTLGQRLAGVPQQPRDAARLIEDLARAMHLAHQKGIVHRDLKPSNILLTWPGTDPAADTDAADDGPAPAPVAQPPLCACTPKITDFGLAKRVESGSALTQTGAVLGTPSYMAPEQAEAKKDVGPAVDVYALGAILYEMLTGRPPFRAPTPLDTVLQVLADEPVPPTRLQPGCPRDLETICLKCLHKEPGKRYATAEALADDLQRFLTDRPVLARRTGAVERTRRWCRRNPVVAGLAAALAVLLVVLAVGASGAAFWLREERNVALNSLDVAKDAERRRTEELAKSYLEQARARRYSRQVGQRFQSLEALAEAARIVRGMDLDEGQRDQRLQELRDEAIACLALVDLRPQRRLGDVFIENHGTGYHRAVAFTPSWDVYARAEPDGPISVRSADDEHEITRLPGAGSSAYILTFSPDGRYLIAKYYQWEKPIEYLVWDWRSGRKVVRQACDVNVSPTVDFAFTPDGRNVLLGCRGDGSLGCYDLATGKEVASMNAGEQSPWAIALHADGRRVALAKGREVIIRDAQTGAILGAPWRLPEEVWSLAWCNGTDLLAASCVRQIHLWDAAKRQPRGVLEGQESNVVRLAFNPAGTLLASYGWDNTTRLWDPATGKELLHVLGEFLEFSPDGQRLVYVKGKELGIWSVTDGGVCRMLVQPANVNRVGFSPDGRILGSATDAGAYLWDVARGKQLARLEPNYVQGVFFHPSGDSLTVVSQRGANRWPVRPAPDGAAGLRVGPPTPIPLSLERYVSSASMDAGGHKLAVMDSQRKAIVVDLDGASEPVVRTAHPRLNYLDLSPDGRWLATTTFKGVDVKVWDLTAKDSDKPAATFRAGDRTGTCFSRDGRWLVIDETVQFVRYYYHVGSWELARQETITETSGLGFTADGMMAAASQGGREVRLLDPATGRNWATLPSLQGQRIGWPTFTRDGSQLAVFGDRFVQLWDLHALRARLAAIDLDWQTAPYPPAAEAATEQPLAVTVEGAPGAVPPGAGPRPAVVILPSMPRPRPAKPDEIAGWVRQLDDANEKVRQAAADALLAVGTPAVDALKAAADGPEGTRRQQARTVLDRIAAAEALAPTRVKLKLEEALPADALKALAERSGVAITYTSAPGGAAEKRINLDLEDVSVWEALDRICEAAGLGYSFGARPDVQVSQQAPRPATVRAYAGPLRLHVTGANYHRGLNLFGQAPQTYESLQLQLGLLKEPHTRLLSFQNPPRLTEARDSDGQSLLPAFQPAPFSQVTNDNAFAQAALMLPLKPPDRRNDQLKVLKGVLSVDVMARPQDLVTVPNLAAAQGQTVHGDQGHRLTVDSVQTTGRQWTVRLRIMGPPGWRFDPNQHAVELVDNRGRFARFANPVFAPVPVREPQPEDLAWLGAAPQAPGLGALPWPAVALQRSRQERQDWEGTLRLVTPVAFAAPVKLRLYRFDRLQVELPFELHDVPLP